MVDKAYTQLFYDILEEVLHLSENPSKFSEFLSLKIRELIGVRAVVVAIKSETEAVNIYSVYPPRKVEWANSPDVLKFVLHSFTYNDTLFIDKTNTDKSISQLLTNIEINTLFVIPLIISGKSIGSILLLDVMDTYGIEAIIDLLKRLSGVFALVIKNSIQYHSLEEMVIERTYELVNQNSELIEREQELNRINAEYEVLNIELRNAKERTEASEAQFKNFFENAADAIFIADFTTGIILDANRTASRLMQMPHDKIVGLHQSQLHPVQDSEFSKETFKQQQQDLVKNLTLHPFENKLLRSDGFEIPIEIMAAIVSYNGKKCVMGTFRDITERKRANEELNKTRLLLEKTFVQSPVPMVLVSMPDRLLKFINPATVELLGMTGKPSFVGASLADVDFTWKDFNKDGKPTSFDELPLVRALKGEYTFNEERKVIREDGSERWELASGVPIFDDNGDLIAGYLVMNDITDLKKIEIELSESNTELQIAKAKAEESDRLKSAFLTNMSHEIRTPMNAIIGFSDCLANPNLSNEKKVRYTKIIQQRAYDLLHIIEDILDISKIEAGQLSFNDTEFPLNDFMVEIYDYYRQKILAIDVKRDIELKLSVADELKTNLIRTDSHRLKQIIMNLVDNALKFTHKGSIEFGCQPSGENKIYFFVRDTGIGIAPEKQQIVFDRFRQADDAKTARDYGGTGLGLSIVKGLVTQFKGEIRLESALNVGTTFYVTIPVILKNERNQSVTLNTPKQPGFKKKTILIVEDDAANMEYISEVVGNTGLQLLKAGNGCETIELVTKNPDIALILMDIRLPDMSGYELTRRIRKSHPRVKIIAQTAYASPHDEQECIDAGCHGYLSKPIDRDKLFSLLEENLK